MRNLLLCCFILLPLSLVAQAAPQEIVEPDTPPAGSVTPEEEATVEELVFDDENSIADVSEDSDEESSSRFIPTEEISQDLGVSFPVDI